MAGAVIVADGQSHACLFLAVLAIGNAAHSAFFAECAVVVVHEEQAGTGVAGDIDVRPSIVVEIAGNRGQAVVAARVRKFPQPCSRR
jgi:hypothetical protein